MVGNGRVDHGHAADVENHLTRLLSRDRLEHRVHDVVRPPGIHDADDGKQQNAFPDLGHWSGQLYERLGLCGDDRLSFLTLFLLDTSKIADVLRVRRDVHRLAVVIVE